MPRAGGSFVGSGAYFQVDMSDLEEKIGMLRTMLKPESFQKLMHRTFKEVGQRSRGPIAEEAAKPYEIKKTWVQKRIGTYQLTDNADGGVTCKIPLKGTKGVVGQTFHVSRASGRRIKKGKIPKGTPILTKVLTGKLSKLPPVMKNQGGNPPFYSPAKGVVFTRRTSRRFPIVRVAALGAPQMPLNRPAPEVQDRVLKIAGDRLEHNYMYMLSKGQI